MKKCCECKELKPLDYFSKDKNKKDGRSYKCKSCAKLYAEKWRLENPEKFKKSLSDNYMRNKQQRLAKAKEWRALNSDKKREYNRKRKALLKFNVGWEKYSDEQVINLYGELCHLCGIQIDMTAPRWTAIPGWEYGLHIDHVIPVSKGGPDNLKNVRPAHSLCNLLKSDNVV